MENFKKITTEEIESFLNGRNPNERIINIECSYNDDFVKLIGRNERGERTIRKDKFYPFVWAKYSACDAMCGGDRRKVKALLNKYGIMAESLTTKIGDSPEEERMANGYRFIFRARQPMSYSKFLKFFKEAGTPVYSDRDDSGVLESKNDNRRFLTVTPVEQYMISTGTRLFKGYETYDDLTRLQWDLETEGLVAEKHRINQIGIRTNKGFERIIPVNGNTKEELDEAEKNAIEEFIYIIAKIDPDVVLGHNTENFDWPFIITRCRVLGLDFTELTKKYFAGVPIYKSQKPTTLKLGGEVETFFQTVIPEHIVLDSLHAARRKQATDSNMLKADLKYVTKYMSMNKPNRVYVPGDKINKTWVIETPDFAFNNENGDWYHIDEKHPVKEGYEAKTGRYIVERYLLDDLWETDKVELKLNEVNFSINKIVPTNFSRCCTMGTAGIWKLIILGWSYERKLAIPAFGDGGSFTGGLSRLIKTGFVGKTKKDDNMEEGRGVIKLDYNSLYPSIMLTWHIDPSVDIEGILPSILEYVLTQREKHKKLKKEAGNNASKLKEKYKQTGDKSILEEIRYFESIENQEDTQQNSLKVLGNSAFGSFGAENLFPLGSKDCAERITCTGRQSLRLLLYWFGNLGYSAIVMDTDGVNMLLPETFRYTEENPYIGLGMNRETVKGKKYIEYEADLAEFNDTFMRDFRYHPDAIQKMGVGLDEILFSSIQFSRKNYADYFPENQYPKDVKLVGNTIKSKRLQNFISKFLDKAIRFLLQNKGNKFLEYYYDYVERIYNYQIPLKDIASKGKIKKSMDEYKKDCQTLTKAGRPKSRQAWYELCIKEGKNPDIGETVYYINTGSKKSESDIKKVTKWFEYDKDGIKIDRTKEVERGTKQWKKEHSDAPDNVSPEIEWMKENSIHYDKEYELVFACELLDEAIMESEEDVFCEEGKEYNVAKYIDMFNKRITPLLVCFSKDIRDKILITNPKDRMYFTEEEARLVSGEPDSPGDQDNIEDVLRMEDREIKFWISHPEWIPPYTKECGMDWEAIKSDYLQRMDNERNLGTDKIREKYNEIIENLTQEEINSFIDGKLPRGLGNIIEIDPKSTNFISKQFKEVVIGNINDILQNYSYEDSE